MYKKIKNIFTKNLHWKALSILIATVLWFIVMNINNPVEVKTFLIPLDILSTEYLDKSNITVLNLDEINQTKAEIKVKASRPVLNEVTKKVTKKEVNIYIDLEKYLNEDTKSFPKSISAPISNNFSAIPYPNNNFEIVSFTPASLNLILDEIVSIPKKINIKEKGNLKDGYISSEPVLSSEYIQISGAKSIVDKVDKVFIEIDISNKTGNIKNSAVPIAYDKNGNKIDKVSFNLKEIDVNMNISLEYKIPINKPETKGTPASGYRLKNITFNPNYIQVINEEENLKNKYIYLPSIDISNLKESKEFIFNMQDLLNQNNLNATLKNNDESVVKVFVEIENILSKTINLPTSQIEILGKNDNYITTITKDITMDILGSEEDFKNLNISKITGSVDIKNLTEGTYKLKLNLIYPEYLNIKEPVYVSINIAESIEEKTSIETTSDINYEPTSQTTTEPIKE